MEEFCLKKIPTYIITGFLGSGKTTILQRMLDYCKEKNLTPAVVLNEVGDTNVEQDTFQGNHLLEMLNGCICCSIQEDFTKELHAFLSLFQEENVPDFLLIEGTGIANPIEIVEGLTDPLLIEFIDLYSIITLVDGSRYMEYQSIFSSSKEVRSILSSQISTSSLIVVNKLDLMTEKMIDKVEKKIASQKNSDTPLVKVSFGKLDMSQLLERRLMVSRERKACGCTNNHSCTEHKNDHPHAFQVVKLDVVRPLDRIDFERWLKGLPISIIRGKGIVQLTESVGYFQFQYASKQLQLHRLKEPPEVTPCIILIGVSFKEDEIRKSFHEKFIK